MTKQLFFCIMTAFVLLCYAPFFVPALNRIEPWLGPFPFNVWFALLLNVAACITIFAASKKLWKVSDGAESKK